MVKAFIFDFDGLILDTETTEFTSWQEVFARHGLELTMDVWADCVGRPRGYFDIYAFLQEQYRQPVDIEAVRTQRRVRNKELNDTQDVMPGVRDYLAYAREHGIRTAIASSSGWAWVHGHLARLGIAGMFDTLVCEEDTDEHKPLPGPYLETLRRLGIGAADAVAFEDSPNGIKAAKAAGLFCVAVPNGVTERLGSAGADVTIASLTELPAAELVGRLGTTAGNSPPRSPSLNAREGEVKAEGY